MSTLSSIVTHILSLREDPERQKTELERVLAPFIEDGNSTPEMQKDPYTMNRDPVDEVYPAMTQRLHLQFMDELSPSVLTGKHIKGKDGSSIRIALVDSLTGQVVDSGPVASATVEILVLEEGASFIISERNVALLRGPVYGPLTNGVGVLDQIKFRHTKRWMKKKEYRLGARILGHFPEIQVEEAMTERFTLEDQRGKLYGKSENPSLSDRVWRIKGIGKDGAFHERLRKENIDTVKDFLTLLNTNPHRLAEILRVSTGSKMWKVIELHARTCPQNDRDGCNFETSSMISLNGSTRQGSSLTHGEISNTGNSDWPRTVNLDSTKWNPHLCLQGTTVHPEIGDASLPTIDTIPLYGTHSPFRDDDIIWAAALNFVGASRTVNLESGKKSPHLCLQGTTVHPGIGGASLPTLDTIPLYGTHSPFRDDDITWGSGLDFGGPPSTLGWFRVMRWFSLWGDVQHNDMVPGENSDDDDDHKSENTTSLGSQATSLIRTIVNGILWARSAAQARCRWLSVKRNIGTEISVTDMLKNLTVSSSSPPQDVVPSLGDRDDSSFSNSKEEGAASKIKPHGITAELYTQ